MMERNWRLCQQKKKMQTVLTKDEPVFHCRSYSNLGKTLLFIWFHWFVGTIWVFCVEQRYALYQIGISWFSHLGFLFCEIRNTIVYKMVFITSDWAFDVTLISLSLSSRCWADTRKCCITLWMIERLNVYKEEIFYHNKKTM